MTSAAWLIFGFALGFCIGGLFTLILCNDYYGFYKEVEDSKYLIDDEHIGSYDDLSEKPKIPPKEEKDGEGQQVQDM